MKKINYFLTKFYTKIKENLSTLRVTRVNSNIFSPQAKAVRDSRRAKHDLSLYTNFDYVLCFLIAAIILIPKIPFISVPGIYFNIRIEDFIVSFIYLLWFIGFLLKKISLRKTPLLIPIILFLTICLISTVVGVIRQTVSSPLLGILYFLRYLEYLGIFYLMFSVYRQSNFWKYFTILLLIFISVIIYGILARFNLVPMYRTMLSAGSKLYYKQLKYVQSTFGAHYDFGAYLMLSLPFLFSLFLIVKKSIYKILTIFLIGISLYFLYTSYARSAYLGFIVASFFYFVLLKSNFFLLPILDAIRVIYLYISGRFSKYKYEFYLKFGKDEVKEILNTLGKKDIVNGALELVQSYSSKVVKKTTIEPTSSAIENVNPKPVIPQVIEPTPIEAKTINVSLDPSAEGRLGRWKELYIKFVKSPLLGDGLSSIGIGADSNYIRWLSELGVIGFLSMLFLLWRLFELFSFLYRKTTVKSEKYLFTSLLASFLGLLVNAVFIDVFESSKVSFYFWFLTALASGYYFHLAELETVNPSLKIPLFSNFSKNFLKKKIIVIKENNNLPEFHNKGNK